MKSLLFASLLTLLIAQQLHCKKGHSHKSPHISDFKAFDFDKNESDPDNASRHKSHKKSRLSKSNRNSGVYFDSNNNDKHSKVYLTEMQPVQKTKTEKQII